MRAEFEAKFEVMMAEIRSLTSQVALLRGDPVESVAMIESTPAIDWGVVPEPVIDMGNVPASAEVAATKAEEISSVASVVVEIASAKTETHGVEIDPRDIG